MKIMLFVYMGEDLGRSKLEKRKSRDLTVLTLKS